MNRNKRVKGRVLKREFQDKDLVKNLIANNIISVDKNNPDYVCFNANLTKERYVKKFLKKVDGGDKKLVLELWRNSQRTKSLLHEWVEAVVIAIVLALVIRTYVCQAFKIPSGSMLETLQIGDHILVSKFIYRFAEPERGDIIVFQYPVDPDRDFIKRVIGLPGETIEIKDQIVYINSKPIHEPYVKHEFVLDKNSYIPKRDNFGPFKIPDGQYFMMGDNRDSSMDSRYWGALDSDMIKGRAFIIYWSVKPYNNAYGKSGGIVDYVDTLGSRIRWERFGMMLH